MIILECISATIQVVVFVNVTSNSHLLVLSHEKNPVALRHQMITVMYIVIYI